jgi:hypothetical protein
VINVQPNTQIYVPNIRPPRDFIRPALVTLAVVSAVILGGTAVWWHLVQPLPPISPSSISPGHATPREAVDGFFQALFQGNETLACSYASPPAVLSAVLRPRNNQLLPGTSPSMAQSYQVNSPWLKSRGALTTPELHPKVTPTRC